MIHFKLTEFTKHGVIMPIIADKIMRYHMIPLDPIREALGVSIHVTSGYRDEAHEVLRGRSGKSQHTFSEKGAVDISLFGNTDRNRALVGLLKQSPYMRIAYYPDNNFFHLDYNADQQQWIIGPQWKIISFNELCNIL